MPITVDTGTISPLRETGSYDFTLHSLEEGSRREFRAPESAPKKPCLYWHWLDDEGQPLLITTSKWYGNAKSTCTKILDAIFPGLDSDTIKKIDLEKLANNGEVKIRITLVQEKGEQSGELVNKPVGFNNLATIDHTGYLI